MSMRGPSDLETRFEELFKQNYSRLVYAALDWVDDEDTARDIVSEVFGDVWTRFEEISKEPLNNYLYTAVRNKCLNHIRHSNVKHRYEETVLKQKVDYIEEDLTVHEENLRLIESTIASFTPKTRLVFQQCYIEGHKYQEVAEMMNISVAAVHKHMTKAFSTFKKVFNVKKGQKE